MADLEFSKNVPAPGQGAPLPAPYHRQEKVEVTPVPNYQAAMIQYADSTNWMSDVGSKIASAASTAIATQIGGELGKNPKGNIGIPITDFDKTMLNTYNTQAQATLSLQADKLITESNLETAQASRITPELIDTTNKNIITGLQSILKNAPDAIKPRMEEQFGHAMLDQHARLTNRMIGEQKEDQRNNNNYASDLNAQHAYSFGLNGNEKAGLAAIENTRKLNEASVASRLITPENAKVNIDTARKSYLSGKMINEYEKARAEAKGEEYLKSIADKKPSYLSDSDYIGVTNNLMNYVNHQNALRNQDQQLLLAKYRNTLYTDLDEAALQLNDLKSQVTPIQFEEAQLEYKKIFAKNNELNDAINQFIPNFQNATAFSQATTKLKNDTFNKLVNQQVNGSKETENPISLDDAQVMVAASAPGPIPSFISELNSKAISGNPVDIESAGRQVHALYEAHAGRALSGLTEQSKALFSKYESLRSAMNPVDAAKLATDIIYNQASKNEKENSQSWSNFVNKSAKGIPHSEWALNQVDFSPKDFISPAMAHVYGTDILDLYNTYYKTLNGDSVNALKNVKREVDENYGYTYVNGKGFLTLYPLEKILGYDNKEVVPAIQMDLIDKLNNDFLPQKQMYSDNKSSVYWEVIPRDKIENEAILFGKKYSPIQVRKITKVGNEEKKEIFDIVIQGNSYNKYDISVKSNSGIIPIFQAAPYLGIIDYFPNKERIDSYYNSYTSHPAYNNPFKAYSFEKGLAAKYMR